MIPTEKPCACPSRITAVEVLGVYDGALYFECLACRAVWHRFPEGDWRHSRAETHLAHRMQPSPARLQGDAHGGA